MTAMLRLTEKQRAVADRIRNGCGFISANTPWGVVAPVRAWFITNPYSDEDGRVCEAMLSKGAIQDYGDGDYRLTDAALLAMEVA